MSVETAAVPFSVELKERTWTGHSESEHAGFMHDLMKGEGTLEDYIGLVAQHWYMYDALESVEQRFLDDPIASRVITPKLTRLASVEADLRTLIGEDWRDKIAPLPSTINYCERIREIGAQGWGGGFVAHHYTRYLGDLSGGQAIGRLMQRYFGLGPEAVSFYHFAEIPSPVDFKNEYRTELDSIEWSPEEQTRVVDEVMVAYRFNTLVFEDLGRAKAGELA